MRFEISVKWWRVSLHNSKLLSTRVIPVPQDFLPWNTKVELLLVGLLQCNYNKWELRLWHKDSIKIRLMHYIPNLQKFYNNFKWGTDRNFQKSTDSPKILTYCSALLNMFNSLFQFINQSKSRCIFIIWKAWKLQALINCNWILNQNLFFDVTLKKRNTRLEWHWQNFHGWTILLISPRMASWLTSAFKRWTCSSALLWGLPRLMFSG